MFEISSSFSLWNTIIGALLLLIKYSFHINDNFYVLLILEKNLSQKFNSMKELDAYIKY